MEWESKHISDILFTLNCEEQPVDPRTRWQHANPVSPGVTLWNHPSGTGVYWLEDNASLFVVAGQLYGYGKHSGSDAEFLPVIAGDFRKGSFEPRSLNGSFVLLILNNLREPSEISMYTDRMGSQHAYLGRQGNSLALGTCFKQVSKSVTAQKLDWPAIRHFAGTGFFTGDKTWFEEVKILPPASHTNIKVRHLNPGPPRVVSLNQSRYWNWKQTSPGLSFAESVEAYDQVFRKSVESRSFHAQNPVGLGISGGLDSRNLLAILRGLPGLYAYSYGYEDTSVELEISRTLCKAAGLDLNSIVIGEYLTRTIDEHLNYSEGFADVTQARQVGALQELAPSMNSLFMGHWGDVFHDTTGIFNGPGTDRHQLPDRAMEKFIKNGNRQVSTLFKGFLPDDYNFSSDLHAVMQTELEHYDLESLDFTLKALKTWQWSFRNTMTGIRVFRMGAEPLMPFYDNHMVDFFLGLPDDYIHDRRLQIAWIKKYAPDLAAVKWQETGFDLGVSRKAAGVLRIPGRIKSKLARTLGRQVVHERNWERQFQGNTSRLEEYLLENNRQGLSGGFDDSLIKNLVENVRQNPDAGNGYAISMLFSLVSTLRWLK